MADNYTYYNLVSSTGVVVPDTADLRGDVEAEYKEIFGAELDVSAETPQGRLIEAHTLGRASTIKLNALVANQINPELATGTFLDAIGALTDCFRKSAVQSSVEATLTGVPGTFIPRGVLARTLAGDDFYLENDVSLALNGSATGIFLSKQRGPIGVPANSLTTIVDGVVGWETVNNGIPATLGSVVQSDQDYRLMRRRTLFTGASYIGALESALWRVENVQGVLVLDNRSNQVVTTDNVTLAPHSIYACVYGGVNEEIALALYKAKTAGAAYNGSTQVTIKDPTNGRSYLVAFQRPTLINVKAEITLETMSSGADLTATVLEAIAAYESGQIPNIEGLNIGVDVSPFELGAAIVSRINGVLVRNVRIAKMNGQLDTKNIEIHANEMARIPAASVIINLV